MTPRISVIIPAYNEASNIVPVLDRITENVELPFEVLVVYDTIEDTTAPVIESYSSSDPRVRGLLNTQGPGPA